jgi:hypothetical protein
MKPSTLVSGARPSRYARLAAANDLTRVEQVQVQASLAAQECQPTACPTTASRDSQLTVRWSMKVRNASSARWRATGQTKCAR